MRRDRGQLAPLLAAFVVMAALVGAAVADLACISDTRARAQTAADAAALAAAGALFDGRDPAVAAGRLARENGAVLVRQPDIDLQGWAVDLTVSVRTPTLLLGTREVTASARAAVDVF